MILSPLFLAETPIGDSEEAEHRRIMLLFVVAHCVLVENTLLFQSLVTWILSLLD